MVNLFPTFQLLFKACFGRDLFLGPGWVIPETGRSGFGGQYVYLFFGFSEVKDDPEADLPRVESMQVVPQVHKAFLFLLFMKVADRKSSDIVPQSRGKKSPNRV